MFSSISVHRTSFPAGGADLVLLLVDLHHDVSAAVQRSRLSMAQQSEDILWCVHQTQILLFALLDCKQHQCKDANRGELALGNVKYVIFFF